MTCWESMDGRTPGGRWPLVILLAFGVAAPGAAHASSVKDAIEVGPGVEPPHMIRDAEFAYPNSARAERVSGQVVLRICVDAKGKVRASEVVSSPDPRLSKAAREGVVDRLYAPATKDGRPVAVWWQTEVSFRLPPSEAELDATCEAATANDAGPVALGPTDVPPVLVKHVDPDLPWASEKISHHGDVTLQCLIDACGRVLECSAMQTSGEAYTRAAVATVTRWRYSPAIRDGRPVSVYLTIRVSWRP
jgi:TonB family protein